MLKSKRNLIFLFFGILAILPFIILSFFIHPSADDFVLTTSRLDTGFWEYQKLAFNSWGGRYFGTLIVSLNPLVYQWSFGYQLFPVFLISACFFSVFLILKKIFTTILSGIEIIAYSLVFTALYFNVILSPAEAFYWLTGAATYTISSIFVLVLINLLIYREKNTSKNMKTMGFITLVVLTICISGSNEIGLATLLLLFFFMILYDGYYYRKIKISVVILFAIALCGGLIVFFAPGTQAKLDGLPYSLNLVYALSKSFQLSIFLLGYHFQNIPWILFSIIVFPFFGHFQQKITLFRQLGKPNFGLSLLISFIIIFSLYFTAYFSLGANPGWRVHNSIQIVFIILWIINLNSLYNFLASKKIDIKPLPKLFVNLLMSVACFFIFFDFYIKDLKQEPIFRSKVSQAYYDLFFKIENYSRSMKNRLDFINRLDFHNIPELIIFDETVEPATIFYQDITNDSEHWINTAYSKYHGLKKVKIETKTADN